MDFGTKYRPVCFDEVIGQKHILPLIRRDFEKKSPGHLYVLTGMQGVGKTTLARLAALYLNCLEMNIDTPQAVPKPCLTCDNCLQIQDGTFPELWEIDAANQTGVDDARQLITSLRRAVGKSKYRVLILDECHMLSKNAWQLWLKPTENGIIRTVCFFLYNRTRKSACYNYVTSS